MNEKMRIGPKRLTVDISEELHYSLRNIAANKGITLRKYVLRSLERAVATEVPHTWKIIKDEK